MSEEKNLLFDIDKTTAVVDPNSVPADGESTCIIMIELLDSEGQPIVGDTSLRLTLNDEIIEIEPVEAPDGSYAFVLASFDAGVANYGYTNSSGAKAKELITVTWEEVVPVPEPEPEPPKDSETGFFDDVKSTLEVSKSSIFLEDSVNVTVVLYSGTNPEVVIQEETPSLKIKITEGDSSKEVKPTWDNVGKKYTTSIKPSKLGQIKVGFSTLHGESTKTKEVKVSESPVSILKREATEGSFDVSKSTLKTPTDPVIAGRGDTTIEVTLVSPTADLGVNKNQMDLTVTVGGQAHKPTIDKNGIYKVVVKDVKEGEVSVTVATPKTSGLQGSYVVVPDWEKIFKDEIAKGTFSTEVSTLTTSGIAEANGVDTIVVTLKAFHKSEPRNPLVGCTVLKLLVGEEEQTLTESEPGTYVASITSTTPGSVSLSVKSTSTEKRDWTTVNWTDVDPELFDDSSNFVIENATTMAIPGATLEVGVRLVDVFNLTPLVDSATIEIFDTENEEVFKPVSSDAGLYLFTIGFVEPGNRKLGFRTSAKTSEETAVVSFTEIPMGLFDESLSKISVSKAEQWIGKSVVVTANLVAIDGKSPLDGVTNLNLVDQSDDSVLGVFTEVGDGEYSFSLTHDTPGILEVCYESDVASLNDTLEIMFKERPPSNPTDTICECMAYVEELRKELELDYSPEKHQALLVEEKLCRQEAYVRGELESPMQEVGDCNND